jgi:hypothetical protein
MAHPGKSFEDLDDDVMQLIVDQVSRWIGSTGKKENERVKGFSLMNKRIRQLCLPRVFDFASSGCLAFTCANQKPYRPQPHRPYIPHPAHVSCC